MNLFHSFQASEITEAANGDVLFSASLPCSGDSPHFISYWMLTKLKKITHLHYVDANVIFSSHFHQFFKIQGEGDLL